MLVKWHKAQLDICSRVPEAIIPSPFHTNRQGRYGPMVDELSHPSRTSSEKEQEILSLKVNETNDQNKNHSHKLQPFTNKRRTWHGAPSVVALERLERLPSCPSMPAKKGPPRP